MSPSRTAAVVEVADRVFAHVQPETAWGINNAGFVVAKDGALLIDTALTERRTHDLLVAVSERTPGSRRTLVNTHYHGDHTNGNCWLPDATIIAHESCRQAMLDAGLDSIRRFPDVDYGVVVHRPPFVTFREQLTVWTGSIRSELRFAGGPAHTTGDVVCWLPEERVLFAGDLAFNGAQPYALAGSVTGFLATIEWLLGLEPRVVVPGHGLVGDRKMLIENRRYFRWLMDVAAAALAAGLSPLEAARDTDPGEFGELGERERLVSNLHRAYADLDPERTVDPVKAYRDMAAFLGRPLRSPA